jgi:hypothetical protein
MNYTTLETPTPSPIIVKLNSNNLTELGIFLSSLLLSISGCFAVVMTSLRNSRCKTISFCKTISCIREPPVEV